MPVLPDLTPAPPSDLLPWVPAADLQCQSPCDIDPETVAQAATVIADNLSGHQFGLRTMRLRPNTNTPSCRCLHNCRCARAKSILISEPIYTITSVKVDGEPLTEDQWTVYRDGRLVRTDDGTFPCCQSDHNDPDSDYGTLEILGLFGSPVDAAAILAVQQIACEITKIFADPADCSLPIETQSFTRQQLSVEIQDESLTTDGFTNLKFVNLWLGALDADAQRRGGRVVDLASQAIYRGPA